MTTNSLFLPPRRADAWDTLPVLDTTALVRDPADSTKRMRIDVGAVATATTRVLTMPDQDVNLTPNTGTFAGAATALTALAALTPAADRLPYFDGASSAALATLTSFIRTLLDDADEATARATLGVTIGTHVQAYDATLAALASFNTNGILTQTAADTFAGRTISGGTGVTVTNGDGVSGNPSIAIGQSVATTATPEFLRIGVGVPSLTQRAFQNRLRPVLEWKNTANPDWSAAMPQWQWSLLRDQIGIRFTGEAPPAEAFTDGFQVRLSGTLVSDQPLRKEASSTANSPNATEIPILLNLSNQFFWRKRVYIGTLKSELTENPDDEFDEVDDSSKLQAYVDKVRDIEQSAAARGTLKLFGIVLDYQIGDLITEVAGRAIKLNRNAESASEQRYLQVIGIKWMPQAQMTELVVAPAEDVVDLSGALSHSGGGSPASGPAIMGGYRAAPVDQAAGAALLRVKLLATLDRREEVAAVVLDLDPEAESDDEEWVETSRKVKVRLWGGCELPSGTECTCQEYRGRWYVMPISC